MTAPVDFTACPRVPGRAYNGAFNDPDLAAARARIVPRIDHAAFARLVAETPYLTDLQREFYTAYFAARAEKLFHVHPRN